MDLTRTVAVARGDEPADLLLANVQLVNVLSGEIYPTDVAVAGEHVVGLGSGYQAREVLDLEKRYLAPGFIDSHVHVESSMVTPRQFARAVVPRGVTAAVTNPHEIANVRGVEGILYMLRDAETAPLDMLVTLPSCVPATDMETAGARLCAEDLLPLMQEKAVIGLGEMMDFPGVVSAQARMHDELRAFRGMIIDGHAPGLTGAALNAYVATGISSDHECTRVEEAREKLRLGLAILIREGTGARNLRPLLPLIDATNERSICFCTDDRGPVDLVEEGSIDHMIRVAIAEGLDPILAIRLATLNPAQHFRLHDRGAVAPGRLADLVAFPDLSRPEPDLVVARGQVVAREGRLLPGTDRPPPPDQALRNTMNVAWSQVSLEVPVGAGRIRVIGVIPDQLFTENRLVKARTEGGRVVADPDRDLLKMAVIDRHSGSGRAGLGFVQGLGLQRGALASTVAHDHHNLVVVGADDESMLTAARALEESGGGLAAAVGSRVLAHLPLPIAGLMSDQPIESVCQEHRTLMAQARELGTPLRDPFMSMSFLALEVIPSLKLTDLGLVDVDRFELVPLFAAE